MTAFEQWWLEGHGPYWKGYISQFEYDNCESAWNAAIDAAISKCNQVASLELPEMVEENCIESIQKLRSE